MRLTRRDHRRLHLAIRLPRRNLGPRAQFHVVDRVDSAPAIDVLPIMTGRTTES